MKKWQIQNKQSGRTHRMILAAVAAAKTGREVTIFVATDNHKSQVERRLRDIPLGGEITPAWLLRIKILVPTRKLDLSEVRPFHPGEERPIFYDHYVLEDRFHDLLSAVHQWDLEDLEHEWKAPAKE